MNKEKADMSLSEEEMERVSGGVGPAVQDYWVCECGADYVCGGNPPPIPCVKCGNRYLTKFRFETRTG